MRKSALVEQKCPSCGAEGKQRKKGYNRSGSSRRMCGECGVTYTIDPKRKEYPEETRHAAIKAFYSGASGRGVGRLFGMSKANVHNWIKKTAAIAENSPEILELDVGERVRNHDDTAAAAANRRV